MTFWLAAYHATWVVDDDVSMMMKRVLTSFCAVPRLLTYTANVPLPSTSAVRLGTTGHGIYAAYAKMATWTAHPYQSI